MKTLGIWDSGTKSYRNHYNNSYVLKEIACVVLGLVLTFLGLHLRRPGSGQTDRSNDASRSDSTFMAAAGTAAGSVDAMTADCAALAAFVSSVVTLTGHSPGSVLGRPRILATQRNVALCLALACSAFCRSS